MATEAGIRAHNHKCERCTKPFACNGECKPYCERCEKEKAENSLTKDLIKTWPQMTEEEAKLLFIRQSASEAYEKGEILEATKGILKTIVETVIVSNMSKDEVGLHISRLENARSFLAAFTQGIQIGYTKEQGPIFKAKHEKERQQKLADKLTKTSDKKVNELIAMARRLAENPDAESIKKVVPQVAHTCEKCGTQTYLIQFHTCPVK